MHQESNSKNLRRYLVASIGGLALVLVVYSGTHWYPRQTIVAQATPDQPASPRVPDRVDGQASPQGPTGPINTGTGGAPASSPQGDTPAGMQTAPQGSDKSVRSPSK